MFYSIVLQVKLEILRSSAASQYLNCLIYATQQGCSIVVPAHTHTAHQQNGREKIEQYSKAYKTNLGSWILIRWIWIKRTTRTPKD